MQQQLRDGLLSMKESLEQMDIERQEERARMEVEHAWMEEQLRYFFIYIQGLPEALITQSGALQDR